jgi:hypothetical protein
MPNLSQLVSTFSLWIEHLSMAEKLAFGGSVFFLVATLYRELRERRNDVRRS